MRSETAPLISQERRFFCGGLAAKQGIPVREAPELLDNVEMDLGERNILLNGKLGIEAQALPLQLQIFRVPKGEDT